MRSQDIPLGDAPGTLCLKPALGGARDSRMDEQLACSIKPKGMLQKKGGGLLYVSVEVGKKKLSHGGCIP